ncbi:DUF72 domain-containing protein [Anaeromyxobacter paludicola]|uniref:Histidine kinase n=1 Tax=Anaeromyxobacter paludicola TaxID=2918171 RepID=A0ABN6NBB0_9BACT|nr:DUF72 domain-containing protein [Anaeromyxobacter paludicola]BDG10505.1 histidine kinase [Anaeromyxobacter paludicola]
MGAIRVGTSGYQYRHWRGVLYPEGLAQRLWLARYARSFDCLELNATFYRLPLPGAVERWRAQVPGDFRFAVKGSRYLTHMKQLLDPEPGLARFLDPVRRLGGKLGPILWQLPPRLAPDPGRLDAFLAAVPEGLASAVEFRSDRWYRRDVCDVLDRRGAAFCEHDLVDTHPPRLTGPFRYLRFHGTTGHYDGRYGPEALQPVARDLSRHARGGGDAWVFFNNDLHGHAVADALSLRGLLEGRVSAAPEPPGPAPAP